MCLFPLYFRYGRTSGSCFGPGILKGSKASNVTIQGDIELAKFFAKKGPRGTYSHFCISRADQSLNKHIPKIYSSASSVEICSPKGLPSNVKKPISNSKSRSLHGPKTGFSWSSAFC